MKSLIQCTASFSMRIPLGFYDSSVHLNKVKIRPKIISLCTSAEPKHFIAASDNSLALLFNYMWTYVFHSVCLKFTISQGHTTQCIEPCKGTFSEAAVKMSPLTRTAASHDQCTAIFSFLKNCCADCVAVVDE